MLGRQRLNLIVIDQAVLLAHTVLDGIEPLTRLVRLGAVGQVTARVQRHAEDRVTGLQ